MSVAYGCGGTESDCRWVSFRVDEGAVKSIVVMMDAQL